MPKISVIMPVYNTKEEYLREAIVSILNQTFTDFEFIIINDGSTNNVEDVILSYKDSRINYIKQENIGISRSLNKGLELAKGEYIARMDSDDISLPERLMKQVEFLDNNPDISLVGTWFKTFPDKKVIKHPHRVDYIKLLKSYCISHPTVMLRKADFEKFDLTYDSNYLCEDYELWSRAIKHLNLANLQEVLLKYRWDGTNLSTATEKFGESVKRVQENMLDFLANDNNFRKRILELAYTSSKDFDFLPKFSLYQMKGNAR